MARFVWINSDASESRLGRLWDCDGAQIIAEGPHGGFIYGSAETGKRILDALNRDSDPRSERRSWAEIEECIDELYRRMDRVDPPDDYPTMAEQYRRAERWKRIEEAAARMLVHIDMSPDTLAVGPAVRDLRAALDSEPKR